MRERDPYHAVKGTAREEEAEAVKIACLGDSLTAGYGVPKKARWTSLLEEWEGWQVENLGIAGDTTGGMLARFPQEVLPLRPDAVILLGGSNDIFTSGSCLGAQSNLAALAQQVLAHGAVPVVATPLPILPERIRNGWELFFDFAGAKKTCGQYAGWLRGYGSVFRLPVLDFYGAFAALPPQELPRLYWDGLHPNGEGHRRMAVMAAQCISRLL